MEDRDAFQAAQNSLLFVHLNLSHGNTQLKTKPKRNKTPSPGLGGEQLTPRGPTFTGGFTSFALQGLGSSSRRCSPGGATCRLSAWKPALPSPLVNVYPVMWAAQSAAAPRDVGHHAPFRAPPAQTGSLTAFSAAPRSGRARHAPGAILSPLLPLEGSWLPGQMSPTLLRRSQHGAARGTTTAVPFQPHETTWHCKSILNQKSEEIPSTSDG